MNDQLDVLREIIAGLEQGGIAYMVSGSTALNYYAEPRMTRDIDIVIELGPHETARFETLHLVSPEDLILSKLEWTRQGPSELQLRDVHSVVDSVPNLDWHYIRSWAGKLGLLPLLEKAIG
jgi:hypothetical protein